jgi:AraC family transcriptional regulator
VLLEYHAAGGPREWNHLAPCDHLVVVCQRRPSLRSIVLDRQTVTVELRPGQIVFYPASVPFSTRTEDAGEYLLLALDPTFIRRAACDLLQPPDLVEWQPAVAVDDPVLAALAFALKLEMENGYPGGRAYGEILAAAAAASLLRNHATVRAPRRLPMGEGLSALQLRRALEYIHSHLAANIPLKSLAATAGISPFHFARLFKQTTGCAPHQYIIRCRLARARQLLLERSGSTADVALEVGFCDQSHLTTHFRRAYGVTPKEFQQAGGIHFSQ